MTFANPELATKIVGFETDSGSKYEYLADGRTRRYRNVSDEIQHPMDAIVFFPPREWIQANAPKEVLAQLGSLESDTDYINFALGRFFNHAHKGYEHAKVRIFTTHNGRAKYLETNKEIKQVPGNTVFLGFINQGHHIFSIPVTIEPRVGWYPFDFRRENQTDGSSIVHTHNGSKISKIEYSPK